MCWNGTVWRPMQQRAADTAGEGDHPGGRARRNDDEAERADAEPGHDRGGDDLASPGSSDGKQVQRQAEPDERRGQRRRRPSVHIGTRRPERPTQVIDWVRASCIAPRLTTATAPTHGTSQRRADRRPTGWRPSSARRRCWRRRRRARAARARSAGRRAAASFPDSSLARREAGQFPAGKSSRNQALIPIWSFVHPPAVPRARTRISQRELKPG